MHTMTLKKREQAVAEIWKKLIPIRRTRMFKRFYNYFLVSEGVKNPTGYADELDIWSLSEAIEDNPDQYQELISYYNKNENS